MSLPKHNVPSATLFYDITSYFHEHNLIFVMTFSNNHFTESLIFQSNIDSKMKTRYQAAITMEHEALSPSCSKKNAALISTELSRLQRQTIYSNKALYLDMKEKDRKRKKLTAVEITKIREEGLKEAEKYWERERVKKNKQRHGNKIVTEAGIEKLNPTNEKKD